VRGAFVRAGVGVEANQSQAFVVDALVEATSIGLSGFTATGSAALRARHVTVVRAGVANNSGGVESLETAGARLLPRYDRGARSDEPDGALQDRGR
jgi:hypothetical protein